MSDKYERHPGVNEPAKHGTIPSSWLAFTDDWRPQTLLALLDRVRAAGVSPDDLDGVRRIWQAMKEEQR